MFLQPVLPLNKHLFHPSRRTVIPGSGAAFHQWMAPESLAWILLR